MYRREELGSTLSATQIAQEESGPSLMLADCLHESLQTLSCQLSSHHSANSGAFMLCTGAQAWTATVAAFSQCFTTTYDTPSIANVPRRQGSRY